MTQSTTWNGTFHPKMKYVLMQSPSHIKGLPSLAIIIGGLHPRTTIAVRHSMSILAVPLRAVLFPSRENGGLLHIVMAKLRNNA